MAVAAVAVVLALGHAPPAGSASSTRSASDLLAQLVTASPHADGYRSSAFGGWADLDKDKCSDRTEVLRSEARGATPTKCTTSALVWTDPWSGATVRKSSDMTVERLVPLAEAWESGAWWLSAGDRAKYANERSFGPTLVAVSRKSSDARAGRSVEDWLPSSTYRCSYVSSWIAVKYRWRLTVDSAERKALTKALKSCGSAKLTVPKRAVSVPPPVDPRMDTCDQLAAAKLGPYRRGERGEYSWYRDDDADGVVCEQQEGLQIYGSHDWRTDRYIATATPTVVARAMQLPTGSSFLHVRILRGSTEMWRAVSYRSGEPTSPDDLRELSVGESVPEGVLTDGKYTAQYWVAARSSATETPSAAAISATFRVDTTPPQAPTTTRSCTDGYCEAFTTDPEVVAIRFSSGGGYYENRRIGPTGYASFALPYTSGPQPTITARAVDRAGNLSAAGTQG